MTYFKMTIKNLQDIRLRQYAFMPYDFMTNKIYIFLKVYFPMHVVGIKVY